MSYFKAKMHEIRFRLGSARDPARRAYSAPPDPLAGFKGAASMEGRGGTIRYDTRCYFNVRLKADMSQLNLPHGTDN